MTCRLFIFCTALLLSCDHHPSSIIDNTKQTSSQQITFKPRESAEGSWIYFLQHLLVVNHPILDYRGKPVSNQNKNGGVIPYDVGNTDLQQCADALIRLRAEYLFGHQLYNQIGFHFTDGHYYSFNDYCNGLRPATFGNSILFKTFSSSPKTHESLRKYLNIVYDYAGTISLARELKDADNFELGTVVIHPGSPGHCFIIADEATASTGEKVYKLVEGYSPAQSIYVIRNIFEPSLSPWYHLNKGTIRTASYTFSNYQLKKFE